MTKRRIAISLVTLFGVVVLFLVAWPAYSLLRHFARSFAEQMDVVKGSALVVAVAALFVAWNNFRRGNTSIVKLRSVSFRCSQSIRVNNGKLHHSLVVELKNVGIPLRSAAVGLHGSTRLGWQSQPIPKLRAEQQVPSDGTLEKGMVATFALRSFEMDTLAKNFVKELMDPDATRLSISVFSENSLVRKFYLRRTSWRRRFVAVWNRGAWWVNEWFAHDFDRWGRTLHSRPEVIPILRDSYGEFYSFAQAIEHELNEAEAKETGISGQASTL